MPNSHRLDAIKSLVPFGTRLLDIGSDHALVPYELLKGDHITRAVVTDINEGPLQSGRNKLSCFRPEKVDFFLSDGFDAVPAGCYDVTAICGMGGELIARIIADGGDKAHCPLILQPMTMHDRLRAYLWDNGFTIERELYPMEAQRTYLVMLAHYTGVPEPYTASEAYIGKLRPETKGFECFVRGVCTAAEARLRGAVCSGDTAAAEREKGIIAEVRRVLRALAYPQLN